MKILYCVTPFGQYGLRVMPILFATRDIGPFALIMLVYVASVAHAFAAMDLANKHYPWNFVDSFFFGTLAEYNKIDEFYSPTSPDPVQNWVTQSLLAGGTFLVPITLMNIFIAALGASYNTGVEHMEQLYQSRKAETVFGLLACKRMLLLSPHGKKRLWYCYESVGGEQ